ncbi:hypothetical protein NBRC111894_2793 [Sporolactobacillus inulinus]|uniref:Uncharacterized protein n=1 Tax=Sporolactobacillus inulinus TaxID=2078 RepID=A0A4Y1ZDY2_9BACL|nr:hypothetical protein NBRC111894_2793 [Sporolactobacillus inulinus]
MAALAIKYSHRFIHYKPFLPKGHLLLFSSAFILEKRRS